MKVKIQEIRETMKRILLTKDYGGDDIDFLIDMHLGGELRGHTSHGLASFPGFVKTDFSHLPEPEIVKETESLFFIDAKSNSGMVVGKRAADEAIARAQKNVVGTAMVRNMDAWLRPGAIAQYIAEQGFLAIVINDGGGTSVAPPGGYDAVVATNPIAYGIPTASTPIVVDMATSKRAWGQVRLANKYGTKLPPDTFYNDKGEVTREPADAHSVMPFGDYKGFALALLVEVMCGSLVGMDNMMVDTNLAGSHFGVKLQDRGGFILVIDPGQTSDSEKFKQANTQFIHKIKQTRALPGREVRIPGEQATAQQGAYEKEGFLEIPEELWQEIKQLEKS